MLRGLNPGLPSHDPGPALVAKRCRLVAATLALSPGASAHKALGGGGGSGSVWAAGGTAAEGADANGVVALQEEYGPVAKVKKGEAMHAIWPWCPPERV